MSFFPLERFRQARDSLSLFLSFSYPASAAKGRSVRALQRTGLHARAAGPLVAAAAAARGRGDAAHSAAATAAAAPALLLRSIVVVVVVLRVPRGARSPLGILSEATAAGSGGDRGEERARVLPERERERRRR